MRLNLVERLAMNNPVRRTMIGRLEVPAIDRMLARHGVDLRGARLLDAGCGEGWSTRVLSRRYGPRRLLAFDLMPEQVARARSRGLDAEVRQGDVTAIEEPDATFDAAFDFGILHHVPAWRQALKELARVLVPGGWLVAEELSGGFIGFSDAVFRTAHPPEVRLDWDSFRAGLEEAGLEVVDEQPILALPFARCFLAHRPVTPAV